MNRWLQAHGTYIRTQKTKGKHNRKRKCTYVYNGNGLRYTFPFSSINKHCNHFNLKRAVMCQRWKKKSILLPPWPYLWWWASCLPSPTICCLMKMHSRLPYPYRHHTKLYARPKKKRYTESSGKKSLTTNIYNRALSMPIWRAARKPTNYRCHNVQRVRG